MPSLENLEKQAKLVLRWHRDRYYPVAAQIPTVLPRFRHLSDREVLAHSFKLNDAQELVARQQGFESWQALKQGLSTMSDQAAPPTSRAVISAIAPELFVADIKASCDFFTQKLGFSIVFTYSCFFRRFLNPWATMDLKIVTQAPSIEETLALWAASLGEIKTRIRPLFRQERVATNAGLFLEGLLGDEQRKNRLDARRGSWRSWPLAATGDPWSQGLGC